MPDKISFVTVFFKQEVRLLQLQALSLVRFFNHEQVGDIVLIANELCDDETIDYVKNQILPIYEAFADRVHLLTWNDFFPHFKTDDPTLGWYTQQPLKIAAHAVVSTEFYIILDCKNHFVRDASIRDFFTPDGRIKCTYGASEESNKTMERTFSYFGIDPKLYGRGRFGSKTPYGVRTATMKSLMQYVFEREGVCLAHSFARYEWKWTEFFLMFAYMLTQCPDQLILDYFPTERITSAGSRKDVNIESILRTFNRYPDLTMLDTHRERIAGLNDEEREAVAEFWIDAGLLANRDHAEFFMKFPE